MRWLFNFIAIIAFPFATVDGAETPWQELGPGARARLITSDQQTPQGTMLAALQVEMPAGSKTYWRQPGETGIPTEILGGEDGAKLGPTHWPYPTIDTKGGYVDFVYYGGVTIPFEIETGGAPHAAIAVTLGICSDICVPARAEFSLPLSLERPDRGNSLRIRQAMASVPLAWTPTGVEPLGEATWSTELRGLLVSVDPLGADPESLIASVADGSVLFGAPQKSPEANLVLLPLLGNNGSADGVPTRVLLTFMTEAGPFEVERDVLAAPGLSRALD